MRNISPEVLALMDASVKQVAIFYEGEFADGTLRLWSGYGTIEWRDLEWTGAGHLGTISPMTDTVDAVAEGVTLSLSGLSPDLTSAALAELRQGKPGVIWIGFFNSDGELVIDESATFAGRLDVGTIEDSGDTATISIIYEGRLRDLERNRERRRTHEDQLQRYPGDMGLEYTAALIENQVPWGRS